MVLNYSSEVIFFPFNTFCCTKKTKTGKSILDYIVCLIGIFHLMIFVSYEQKNGPAIF